MYPAFLHFSHSPSRLFLLTAMHLHDRFAEFLSASEIIEATPALLNDQRRRFVSFAGYCFTAELCRERAENHAFLF